VNQSPPTRALRENPDLDQLKRQAKELLAGFTAGSPDAVREVNAHYHAADPARFALHDAQLVLARAYGFESWTKLKAYVDGVRVGRLCDAVELGDLAAVRGMLHLRPEIVNLERPRHGEQRAIHIATLRRDSAMVRLLMEHGADARVGMWPHRDATSALTFAMERGFDEIAAIIHEEERRRNALVPSATALPELEWCADEDRAIQLLDANPVLVHQCDADGWTMLHAAAGMLQPRVVEWLLAHGAHVHSLAEKQWTPLDFAASGRAWPRAANPAQFPPIATSLLRAGAKLSPIAAAALGDTAYIRHATDRTGLLSIAVLHRQTEMLALLLELGLDPDERTRVEDIEEVVYSWGEPLYRCAASNNLEMAEMLLARGADPNARIFASGTPVGRAFGVRHSEMVKLLERYGGVVYAANAGYYRDPALARRLLAAEDAGCLPKGAVNPGESLVDVLLATGATGGDPEIVRMALDRIDWPPDDPRWLGKLFDPLCFWNHLPRIPTADPSLDRATYLECFRLILERCDPNVFPKGSLATALHEVAAMYSHVKDHEVVAFATLLLDAGARMDVREPRLQSTPLGWACRWGRAGLVELLLSRGADPVEADAEPWARPLAWAEKMNHPAALAILRRRLATP
jgi:ankyrin repeat protein